MSMPRQRDFETLLDDGTAIYIEYEYTPGERASYWEPGCGAEIGIWQVTVGNFPPCNAKHFPDSWLQKMEEKIAELVDNNYDYFED